MRTPSEVLTENPIPIRLDPNGTYGTDALHGRVRSDPLCAIGGISLPRWSAAATSQRGPNWCDPTLRRACRQRPVPSPPAVRPSVSYRPALDSKRRGLRCSCRSMPVKSVQQSAPASTGPVVPPAHQPPWVVPLPAQPPGHAEDQRSDELPMAADREHVPWIVVLPQPGESLSPLGCEAEPRSLLRSLRCTHSSDADHRLAWSISLLQYHHFGPA